MQVLPPSVSDFVSLSGLGSLGVSGFLFWYAHHAGHKAKLLGQATPTTCTDIANNLRSITPIVVALRGRVEAHAPLQCELSDKQCVIREIIEEELFRKERDNGRVTQEPFEVRRVFEQADWFIEDGGPAPVRVENGAQAERLRTALVTSQTFTPEDPNKTSLTKLLLEKAVRTMLKYGVRKTERSLTLGSVVTVVGELWCDPLHPKSNRNTVGKDSSSSSSSASSSSSRGGEATTSGHTSGTQFRTDAFPFVLRKPAAGPFYITPLTLEQLRASLTGHARTVKVAAMGFGALGVLLLARKAVLHLLKLREQAQIQRRMDAIEEEHKRLREARGEPSEAENLANAERPAGTCVVCMEAQSDLVFVGCGHLCCCYRCGHELTRCPMCRTRSATIKLYVI